MNFRRQPFQFNTIDPAKRQAELQKRFGLPTNNSDMYVDFLNPGLMGAGMREPSLASAGSPRLQHRLPKFTENASKADSEQNNVDGGHKPRVRVVPIQVEGVDDSRRHRTYSGPAGMVDGSEDIFKRRPHETFSCPDEVKKPSQPRVCNIPIQIEPRDVKPRVQPKSEAPEVAKKLKTEKSNSTTNVEKPSQTVPNVEKKPEPAKTVPEVQQNQEPVTAVPLKQIETVLSKLKGYGEEVEKFSGTSKDKQYRYLDEMLTRCMLDLDNVDTMGLDEIRKSRKEAVRQVQHFVDLLDDKVNVKMESESSSADITNEAPQNGDTDIPTEASENVTDTSGDVEMNDIITESKDIEKNTAPDVDMVDETVASEPTPEIVSEVSQDEVESSGSVLEVDMESTPCNEPDSEMNECENKSRIVIEELDPTSNNCVSEVADDNVSCVVTTSPELSVKEAIVEEDDSTAVIEEVEDSEHSINNCATFSSVNDNDVKLSEQVKIESESSVTDTELPSVDLPPVDQERLESQLL